MPNALLTEVAEVGQRKIKSNITQHFGYGKPDVDRVKECLETRATIIGYGELNEGDAHVFRLPIPSGLGGVNIWRKLTITLSWFATPCPSNLKYRDSILWLTLEGDNKTLADVRKYDWQQVRRGTLHHEIFEGNAVTVLSQNKELEIKVNCQKDAAPKIINPIKYAVAITLEVSPNIDIHIYQEIQAAINIQIQQQVQERIQTN